MHVFKPQAVQLWGWTLTTVYKLLCSYWSHELEFASAGSGVCQDIPLDTWLVRVIGLCSDVCSVASREVLWCRSMSDASHDCPWATCFELQSDPHFVAASAEPWCLWGGPNCAPNLSSTSTEPRGWSAEGSWQSKIHHHLPPSVSCLLGSVTERTSGSTQVSWGWFSVSHQVGASGIH